MENALDNLNEAINTICDLSDCLDMLDNIRFAIVNGSCNQNYDNQMSIVLEIAKQKCGAAHQYVENAHSQCAEAKNGGKQNG